MTSGLRMKTMLIIASATAALSVGGCAERHLSSDFGSALHQSLVAQIADPEPRYAKTTAPGSNGKRVAGAADRYEKDRVIQPTSATTFKVNSNSAGAGASSAPAQ